MGMCGQVGVGMHAFKQYNRRNIDGGNSTSSLLSLNDSYSVLHKRSLHCFFLFFGFMFVF